MAAIYLKKTSNCNVDNFIDTNVYNERMYEGDVAKFDLISRLNTSTFKGNEFNFTLKTFLENVQLSTGVQNEFPNDDQIEIFMFFMNKMLEQEWQKSKKETR